MALSDGLVHLLVCRSSIEKVLMLYEYTILRYSHFAYANFRRSLLPFFHDTTMLKFYVLLGEAATLP